jgi:hypothetical protein
MNHAEEARKLMARYHSGTGSDTTAIAHALLAINETLQKVLQDEEDDGYIPSIAATDRLRDLNQRIVGALLLADKWEAMPFPEGLTPTEHANQLREVLR